MTGVRVLFRRSQFKEFGRGEHTILFARGNSGGVGGAVLDRRQSKFLC